MKTITFCFDHPVAVKVFFNCISNPTVKQEIKFIRSDESGCLTIPANDIPEGLWNLTLEWNYEGRDFCMEKQIEFSGSTVK